MIGAVMLVARNGRIVHLEAHGLMDVSSSRPMQTDAVFRIMSMTRKTLLSPDIKADIYPDILGVEFLL